MAVDQLLYLTVLQYPCQQVHIVVKRSGAHKVLTTRLTDILSDIGCQNKLIPCSAYLGNKIPIAGVAHQCGTIRFGVDPNQSALDINCKAHDLDNLYVVDGSFFVSRAAVNPALTIMANALRVAGHLIDRLN